MGESLALRHGYRESPDAIIVGCGMAGLSACWAYRKGHPDASVLMLDQHPIFGGEAKQNELEVDGYRLTAPQGATGIVVPFNKAKDAGMWTHFATDLGFPDEFAFQKPSGLVGISWSPRTRGARCTSPGSVPTPASTTKDMAG